MILGVGSDITRLDRFQKFIDNKKFINRVLTTCEREAFFKLSNSNKANFLAKRFSGKEAFSKALGTGIGSGCSFQSLQILKDQNNAPFIEVLDYALKKQISFSFVSFSDEKIKDDILISSFVILEK